MQLPLASPTNQPTTVVDNFDDLSEQNGTWRHGVADDGMIEYVFALPASGNAGSVNVFAEMVVSVLSLHKFKGQEVDAGIARPADAHRWVELDVCNIAGVYLRATGSPMDFAKAFRTMLDFSGTHAIKVFWSPERRAIVVGIDPTPSCAKPVVADKSVSPAPQG